MNIVLNSYDAIPPEAIERFSGLAPANACTQAATLAAKSITAKRDKVILDTIAARFPDAPPLAKGDLQCVVDGRNIQTWFYRGSPILEIHPLSHKWDGCKITLTMNYRKF